jgi:hypothetical protein
MRCLCRSTRQGPPLCFTGVGKVTGFYAKAQKMWRAQKGFRCPYMAMIDAAERGVGLSLSASDVRYLAQDAAIGTVASNHYEEMLDAPLPGPLLDGRS